MVNSPKRGGDRSLRVGVGESKAGKTGDEQHGRQNVSVMFVKPNTSHSCSSGLNSLDGSS